MKKTAIVVASVFLVSGCATTGQDGSQGQNVAIDTGVGAGAGAGLGCLLAQAFGKNCISGAIIGAAVGALVGWSYESEKVATAEHVNEIARKEKYHVPKDKVVLESYDITSNANSVKQGDTIVTNSSIKLIGYSNTPPKVEERLALVTPDGTEGTPQVGKLTTVDGAGEYRTTGKFTIPQSFPEGKYLVKSKLYLDDKVAAGKSFKVQVAYIEGNQVIRLVTAE